MWPDIEHRRDDISKPLHGAGGRRSGRGTPLFQRLLQDLRGEEPLGSQQRAEALFKPELQAPGEQDRRDGGGGQGRPDPLQTGPVHPPRQRSQLRPVCCGHRRMEGAGGDMAGDPGGGRAQRKPRRPRVGGLDPRLDDLGAWARAVPEGPDVDRLRKELRKSDESSQAAQEG